MIEAVGVPYVEVELILLNGESVDFAARLSSGDRVAVCPSFRRLVITSLRRVRKEGLTRTSFALDAHLGKLARSLRLLGLDAAHSNAYEDEELVALAVREGRIVLTRDRELLKRAAVTYGYWVRSTDPVRQAQEVVQRFNLRGEIAPFTRCLKCNGRLARVAKDAVQDWIPPRVAAWRDEYLRCVGCGKLYWEGTHHPRLRATLDRILEGTGLNGIG